MKLFPSSHLRMGWVFLGIWALVIIVPVLTGNDITQFFTLLLAAWPWDALGQSFFGKAGLAIGVWSGLVLNSAVVFLLGYLISRTRIILILFRSPYSKGGWQFLGIYVLLIILFVAGNLFFPRFPNLFSAVLDWVLGWRGLFSVVLVFLLGYFRSFLRRNSSALVREP